VGDPGRRDPSSRARLIFHSGELVSGSPQVGQVALAQVNVQRRLDIMRNHTATHLLDHELRSTLGKHVQQAGSVVAPDRLRFDFTHPNALSQEQVDAIERSINAVILADHPVQVEHATYRQALADGAIALFTEKYGEEVRVIRSAPRVRSSARSCAVALTSTGPGR